MSHMVAFVCVVSVQLLVCVAQALRTGQVAKLSQYLIRGMLVGIPFGITFDTIVGEGFGMFDYELGYGPWFLVVNGFFSYGFMLANVCLLQTFKLRHVYVWSVVVGVFYESINYLTPVWEWTFAPERWMEELAVIFVCYFGLTIGMMVALRITGVRFLQTPRRTIVN